MRMQKSAMRMQQSDKKMLAIEYEFSLCQSTWKSHSPYGRPKVNIPQRVYVFQME